MLPRCPALPVCAAALCASLGSTVARAEGEATCDRLRAEARSEAAVLYAPKLEVELARVPEVATPSDPIASATHGAQGRLALALSPVDMLRGRAIQRVADADCARELAARQLEHVLAIGGRYGELAATTAELDYLTGRIKDVDALVDEVAARFGHQRATALELQELRTRRAVLQRRIAELRHDRVMQEELDGDVELKQGLDQAETAYRGAALRAEARRGDVRTLSAWQFDVRAGLAATATDRADWFAIVDVGYSLGQPWQHAAENAAERAHRAELAGDAREIIRVEQLKRALHRSVETLEAELHALDDELALRKSELDRLASLDSDAAHQLRASATIELVELGGRRAAVVALIAKQRALLGGTP